MAEDKISIIVPVFNPGPVLIRAIESVRMQTYNNIELIIVDGASNDGTIALLKKYRTHITFWISEPDEGIYDAMNKGITASTGVWLLFLGADDELCPDVISTIFKSSSFGNIDMIYGKVSLRNEGRQFGQQTDFDQLISVNVPHQAIFYRKSIFEKFKGYNQRYKILADYDLNLQIFADTSLQKKFVDKTVTIFSNDGISNRTIDYRFFTEKKEYFINNLNLSRYNKSLAKYYFFTGIALVLKRNFREGIKNICHAILFSRNRFRYFLLTVDFIFSLAGVGKKYKYV